MSVFDLSQAQADYILEMQLRRLTRFSRIELEKEQEELRREIEELDAILGRREAAPEGRLRRAGRGRQDLRHPAAHRAAGVRRHHRHLARPCRSRSPTTRASRSCPPPACWPARRTDEPLGSGGARTNHDVVVSAVRTTARGEVGVVTSRGRLLKLGVLDLPAIPASANDPNLQGGVPLSEVLVAGDRRAGARALPRCPPTARASRSAPARASSSGSTPRCSPATSGRSSRSRTATRWSARSTWPPARRRSASSPPTPSCCTSAPTPCVRRAARAAASPASGSPPASTSPGSARSTPTDAVVVTASGSSTALPGTEPGAVKVTPFSEYPAKGRATGGVRCHRFLKGEDALVFAWAGPAPARAAAASGAPVELPAATGRRDGSGVPGSQPIAACAGPLAGSPAPLTDRCGQADAHASSRPPPPCPPARRGCSTGVLPWRCRRAAAAPPPATERAAARGAGRGQEDARRHQRGPDPAARTDDLPAGRHRAHQGRRHRHPRRRRSTARSRCRSRATRFEVPSSPSTARSTCSCRSPRAARTSTPATTAPPTPRS